MTNEALSRRLGRLDKRLGRLVDCLAPPKKTETDRRRWEDLLAAEQRAAESRARRGLEPLPEEPPIAIPPGRKYTIHELMVDINKGRTRVAAEKQKRDAEAKSMACQTELISQELDPYRQGAEAPDSRPQGLAWEPR